MLPLGILCIFIFSGNSLFAQTAHEIDSLWGVVASLKGHSKETLQTKKQKLSDMFGLVLYGDIPMALRVTDSLAETCRLLGDSAAYYEALYRNKASIYQTTSDYRRTFDYLRSYANAVTRIGKNNGYAYVDVGNQYYGVGLSEIAREYYLKANAIFTKEKNYAGNCTVLDNLGLIWREKKNADSCVYYFNRSAQIRRDSIHDPYLEAYSYVAAGGALMTFKRYSEAYRYLCKARAILDQPAFEQYKDFVTMRETRVNCCRYLAMYFLQGSNIDSAKYFSQKASSLVDEYSLERQRPLVLSLQARLALEEKNYPEAFRAIRENEAINIRRNDPTSLLDVYELYTRFYRETGDWKNASIYQERRSRLNDSLSLVFNDDQMLIMNNALLQFDNDAKIANQAVELGKREVEVRRRNRQNQIMLLAILGLVLMIALGSYLLLQFRKKNKLIEKYNADLEAANKTKEKFLSVISHDLRSPFNTLIGMSNLLVANVKRNDYGQLASNAEAINESSRKAYVLLDNLMQWVSVQKENISVNKKQVPLGPLVDEILLLFRNQALAQSVTIEKDLRVQSVFTDPNMLQVMLRNLLSNAVRHIPTGGKVSLRIEAAEKDVLMTIRDNGNGIDPEILQSLFKTKEGINIAKKGGGLGLELVQEFVEKLGGSITAENAAEGGAVFRIRLFDAAVSEMVAAAAEIEAQKLKLTPEERGQLGLLVLKMRAYEIFDTTELRKLLEEDDSGNSDSIAEWKKRMQQAVYHSDALLFGKLLELVEKEA